MVRLINCLLIAAIYCPALDLPEYATISTRKVDYLTLVKVSCNDGFMFSDRNFTTYLQCIESAGASSLIWNDTINDCIR